MASGPFLHSGAWRTAVTANDSTQQEELGAVRFENSKIYRYVKVSTAGTLTAGQAVSYSDTTGTLIKVAPAATASAYQQFVGIAETALSTSFFGWITVYGPATALVDTTATIGTPLIASATAGALCPKIVVYGTSATTGTLLAQAAATALTTGVITGSTVFVQAF